MSYSMLPETLEGSVIPGNVPTSHSGQEQDRQLGPFPLPLEMLGNKGGHLGQGRESSDLGHSYSGLLITTRIVTVSKASIY